MNPGVPERGESLSHYLHQSCYPYYNKKGNNSVISHIYVTNIVNKITKNDQAKTNGTEIQLPIVIRIPKANVR